MLHTFGENLRELREERNLKQKEVADALFISNKMLSSYERNISQPPIDMLIRICEYFQVSADSLLGIDEPAGEYTPKHEEAPQTQSPEGAVLPPDPEDCRILGYYHQLDVESQEAIRGLLIYYCKAKEYREELREAREAGKAPL
jgi:transcriptional regulator with XRE-family HTH domain